MLGIGLVGCGAISGTHMKAIKMNSKAELIALCDVKEEYVKELAKSEGCLAYTDYKDLIANPNIDIIHICTPHYLHSSMIQEAVSAGKHVLCEKPIVMNMEHGKELLDMDMGEQKVAVCFQNRFNNSSVIIKSYIQDEKLGSLLGLKGYVTWYRDEAYYEDSLWRGDFKTEGGGVLINQSIHTLDLLQWFGGEMSWIKGSASTRVLNQVIEVEDTSDATIQFGNGVRGLFYATNCNVVNSPVELEATFEKGTLRLFNNKLFCITEDGMEELSTEGIKEGEKSYWGKSHNRLIDAFYTAVIEDSDQYIDYKEGLKAIKMIKGIYASKGNNQISMK